MIRESGLNDSTYHSVQCFGFVEASAVLCYQVIAPSAANVISLFTWYSIPRHDAPCLSTVCYFMYFVGAVPLFNFVFSSLPSTSTAFSHIQCDRVFPWYVTAVLIASDRYIPQR